MCGHGRLLHGINTLNGLRIMLNKLDPYNQCLDVLKEHMSSLFSWIVWVNKLDQMFLIEFDT